MFRSVSDGWTLWDSVLPEEAVRLPVELAGVDRVLDHTGLLEVFRSEFSPGRGRRSIPMETFLRLMYLKWSNRWGYDRLVEIVSGSITYKVFARIPIGTPVPDASTLKHLTKRFRPDTIGELNRVLIDLGVEAGVVDVSRVRVDTTTVEANIAYPTDSGLLTKAIRQLTSNANTLSAVLGLGVRVEDLTAEVVEANRELGAWARTRHPERRDEILAITDRLADLATEAGSSAARVLEAATVALAAMGVAPRRARRARNRLAQACEALPALVAQAKARAGHEPVPSSQQAALDPGTRRSTDQESDHAPQANPVRLHGPDRRRRRRVDRRSRGLHRPTSRRRTDRPRDRTGHRPMRDPNHGDRRQDLRHHRLPASPHRPRCHHGRYRLQGQPETALIDP